MSDNLAASQHSRDLDSRVDTADILMPPSWQGLRQQLVYLAQFGGSIQVIQGLPGAGKTTLFEYLLQRERALNLTGLRASALQGDFFAELLGQLGLRPVADASRGELIAALRHYVQTLHRERSRAVVLIDDADHLGDAELGALVSVLQGFSSSGLGLHLVFFARPGLAVRLDNLQVLDVAVHDVQIPTLSPTETADLLAIATSRLGMTPLSQEQAQRLWLQSAGVPGRALHLLEAFRPKPKAAVLSMKGLPLGHLAALVLLCGVLVWAFLVRESAPPTEYRHALELPQPVADRPRVPGTVQSRPVLEPLPQNVQGLADVAPVVQQDAVSDNARPDEIQISGADLEVISEEVQEPTAESPTSRVPPESPVSEPQSAPAVDSAAPAIQAGDSANTALADAHKKLLAYPPEAYVLQLMAISNLATMREYVAAQPNRANLLIYQTHRQGRPLYILVEGFYADQQAAQAGVANLPEAQRRGGPWPKRLEVVHREIRQNN